MLPALQSTNSQKEANRYMCIMRNIPLICTDLKLMKELKFRDIKDLER